jgi:hypothetical protein
MDRRTTAIGWIYTVGVLLIVLGIIQGAAAPLVLREPLTLLLPSTGRALLFLYLATAATVSFCGWITLFLVRGFKREEVWAWPIAWRVAVFLVLLGIGSVVAWLTNPFSHVLAALAILYIVPLFTYRPEFSQNRREALPTGTPYIEDHTKDWRLKGPVQ